MQIRIPKSFAHSHLFKKNVRRTLDCSTETVSFNGVSYKSNDSIRRIKSMYSVFVSLYGTYRLYVHSLDASSCHHSCAIELGQEEASGGWWIVGGASKIIKLYIQNQSLVSKLHTFEHAASVFLCRWPGNSRCSCF